LAKKTRKQKDHNYWNISGTAGATYLAGKDLEMSNSGLASL